MDPAVINQMLALATAVAGLIPAVAALFGNNGSRILLKLESENPTGSMKDRCD